jgi:hypothetical protein
LVDSGTEIDYLLRPIEAGMICFERLHDTVLDLNDFADANDYLDAKAENEYRLRPKGT